MSISDCGYSPRLRFIDHPENDTGNRATRRAERRITSQESAATYFKVHPRTVRRWLTLGHITGYQDRIGVLVDLNEIEAKLASGQYRMSDGRRPKYGDAAHIVPLPITEPGA